MPLVRPALDTRRWAPVALGSALALVLAVLPPFVPEGPRRALMLLFRWACHQDPARSLAVGGVPLALCHRCAGVLLGLTLGAAALPLVVRLLPPRAGGGGSARAGLVALVLASVPAGVDWGLGALGLWANTPVSRLATGAAFGVAAGLVLARAAAIRVPKPQAIPASAAAPGRA